VTGAAASQATARAGRLWLDACGNGAAVAGGGGKAAVSIRQPVPQRSAQILLLLWSSDGDDGPPAAVWQRKPLEFVISAAAALAVPKLAIRPASAIK
jgi:hypothetical protein